VVDSADSAASAVVDSAVVDSVFDIRLYNFRGRRTSVRGNTPRLPGSSMPNHNNNRRRTVVEVEAGSPVVGEVEAGSPAVVREMEAVDSEQG
jgi:hypothetical protein